MRSTSEYEVDDSLRARYQPAARERGPQGEEPNDGAPNRYTSIGSSALRHPVLVGLMAIVGLLAGLAVGYEHPVTYSAQVQLIVGRTADLAEDQVPGLAQAVQGLAADYARLISSSTVISATEANLGRSSLPGTLTASPVAQSSVIDVSASAPTKANALNLADAGAAALTKVVTQVTNDTQAQLSPIMAAFTKADTAYEQATARYNQLEHQLNVLLAQEGNRKPTAKQRAAEKVLNAQIVAAATTADTDRLEANAYQNQYFTALPPLQTQQEMVQQVGQATYTGSNRSSYVEAAGLVGLVGGVVVGLAIASWVESRRSRRTARLVMG